MKTFSGIVFEHNPAVTGSLDAPENVPYTQRFKLPSDYPRGTERVLPSLSGFQLFVETDLDEVNIEWSLERTTNRQNEVQQIILNGTTSGYRLSFRGEETALIDYDATDSQIQTALEELDILANNVLVNNLRVTFVNRLANSNVPELQVLENEDVEVVQAIPAYIWIEEEANSETIQVVSSSGKAWLDINLNTKISNESLVEDWRLVFTMDAKPCYALNSGPDALKAELYDETPLVALGSNSLSILHRILAATLDSSVDFLGNNFRSAVKEYGPQRALTKGDSFWMSSPNPSKFAVESLYFDVRQNGESTVVNRMLIDPVTPGITCNLYYSTEEQSSNKTWDELWWRPIPKIIELTAKQEFVMPFPVTASFIKLEFTKLQARPYMVGEHQQKIVYNKHPKWVLDHFYQIYLERKQSNQIPSNVINLQYNALDLYYNYFLDDLVESPYLPQLLDRSVDTNVFNDYLSSITNEETDDLDPITLSNIKTANNSFAQHPLNAGPMNSLLTKHLIKSNKFPVESIRRPVADTEFVTTADRDSVQMDREFPAMSFYLPTRHQYKRSRATFENDRAYFAGVKQVAFYRDYYSSEADLSLYSETAGDEINLEINDLVLENGEWTGS
jgi:hypothetical protein